MALSVVIGTCNRIDYLKRCIESILAETSMKIKVYVADAGSTDGTIEYLSSIAGKTIIPSFTGQKVGQARAYNELFRLIDTQYVCWLSDDDVVVNSGLDIAVNILSENSDFGMVALKTKDVQGPFVRAPYIGGISSIGILNVNQGVLPTKIIQQLGGFCEEFRDYGIDPDLTARVLFSGYKIAYTKQICLHHYRVWPNRKDSKKFKNIIKKNKQSVKLYNEKYGGLIDNSKSKTDSIIIETAKSSLKNSLIYLGVGKLGVVRDFYNIFNAKYISMFDPVFSIRKKYHLLQNPPKKTVQPL